MWPINNRMKSDLAIIFSILPWLWLTLESAPAFAQNLDNTCLSCHLELGDELGEAAQVFSSDVHNIEGVSCAGCHGGDPAQEDAELAMSSAKGFIGKPSVLQIPAFCGRCHSDPVYMRRYNPSLSTDQLEKYWTSRHGELNRKGDKKVAQCVSCHSVHEIHPATDPRSAVHPKNVPRTCAHCHADPGYMASYKIPTNQFDEYRSSVHGVALLEKNDLGAPACNDCHGNHAAVPPGVSSIGRVCFQCHLAEGELFIDSPHKNAFDELGVPECAFCHGHHTVRILSDQHLGVMTPSVCIECHSEGEAGYEAAGSMSAAIIALKERYQAAKTLIDEAERKGVEVSDEQFKLLSVRQSLINVRTLIHSFDPGRVTASTREAMKSADEVYQAGVRSVEEVKKRRTGFIVFSIVTIFLVIVIYVRLRQRSRA